MRFCGLVLFLVCAGGCSTAPCADLLDWLAPGRIQLGPQDRPYGGVCLPQGGPIGPVTPGAAGGPPLPSPGPLPVPAVPVQPAPVPSPSPATTPPPPVFPGG
jgi:hypothetical protein